MAAQVKDNHSVPSKKSWPHRNHIAIFVRCLHLLDLDLLEDWPGVDEQLFSAKTAQQNLQHRVKTVEWSLYRLFEIYDPGETRDKLRPFFPPVAPLQSLNLRAALYRCLTELKKNGVLGKDALLRKTMLDECKGERFEEVIASFAMTVLHAATNPSTNSAGRVPFETEPLPMVLAYKVALQSNLRARREADTEAQCQLDHLKNVHVQLEERLQQSKAVATRVDNSQQKELRGLLNSNWIGAHTWTDILLRGGPGKKELLEVNSVHTTQVIDESHDLLHHLENRIQKQQARLLEWEVIANDLMSRRDREKPLTEPQSKTVIRDNAVGLRFSKHKGIQSSNSKGLPALQEPQDETYGRMRNTMRREMSEPSVPARKIDVEHGKASPASLLPSVISNPSTPSATPPSVSSVHFPNVAPPDTEAARVTAFDSHGSTQSGDVYQYSNSPSPVQGSDEGSPWIPSSENNATAPGEQGTAPSKTHNPTAFTVPEPPVSPSTLWMSLADRTRASMSFTGRQSMLSDPDSPVRLSIDQAKDYNLPDDHHSSDDERHASLLERTRKSMSLFSSSSGARSRKSRNKLEKRSSQVHPVNQFETPGRLQRQVDKDASSGASTPRETLFDEDAEYASIFKSRPKLALSPAISPARRTSGLDSILEQDMDRLNLDSDNGVD